MKEEEQTFVKSQQYLHNFQRNFFILAHLLRQEERVRKRKSTEAEISLN
jgi:hypothetical protein